MFKKPLTSSPNYDSSGFTYCELSSECYPIYDEDLFLNGDKTLVPKPNCHIRRKKLRNDELKLVLIHDAFNKLKNQINNNSSEPVVFETVLIDKNQKRRPIKFAVNSVYETFKSKNLNYRRPFVKHQGKQRIATVKHSEKLKTVKDCYLLCRQKDCSHFNVCKDASTADYDCELADALGELVADSRCNVYEAKDLNLFDKQEESRFEEKSMEDLGSIGLDECARRCLNQADGRCKSIVFFDNGAEHNCQLAEQHLESQMNRIDLLKNYTIYSSEFTVT